MASMQQQSWQSIDSDSNHEGELCAKVAETDVAAATEDPFVQKPLAASCQGNGDRDNGEVRRLHPSTSEEMS